MIVLKGGPESDRKNGSQNARSRARRLARASFGRTVRLSLDASKSK